MHHRLAIFGLAGASAFVMTLAFAVPPAMADYAPGPHDVVGVGSDTLQYASDFVADGDYVGDPGYNTAGNKYKVVNFDATPDANARLAYGSQGTGTLGGIAKGSCSPGTGSVTSSTGNGTGSIGSGNDTSNHADTPCTLNPTIVLRAGTRPVQRPNGSGAGAKALAGDNQHALNKQFITYSRASSCQDTSCSATNVLNASTFDVLKIGTDPLAILTATTTNAPPLSATELASIYTCNIKTWAGLPSAPAGASTDTIIPIIPQVGSGTRSSFESAIGITDTQLGSCVQTAEENDPTAIAAQTTPADAIEPMSGARLNMFLGQDGSGNSIGAGYFDDPSCPLLASGVPSTAGDCTSGPTITPAVKLVTSGTPSSGSLFDISRNLLIYFRASAVDSTTVWQPGTTTNQIRTLFYNPCDPTTGGFPASACVTIAGSGVGTGTFGPGGPPFYDTGAGFTDISAAGITPAWEVSTTGANNLT